MLRSPNEATPPTASSVSVPESTPPPAFVPMATVMLAVDDVTVFPLASCTVTATGGTIVAPATAVPGCTVNASLAAAPGVTANAGLVAPARPVAAAVSV
jgi:hypothetical protein